MLDAKILELSRKLIHPQLADRQEALRWEVVAQERKAAAEGWHESGQFVKVLSRLGVEEIKIRVRLVSSVLFRVISECRVQHYADLEHDLKGEVAIHAQEAKAAVVSVIGDRLQHVDERLRGLARADLEGAEQRSVELANGDIGLFAHRLSLPANQAQHGGGNIIQVTGSVGAIQTGDWAVANVVQNIGEDERAVVARSLAAVREYLNANPANQTELVEVVNDAGSELVKEKPNLTKLKSLMVGIAGTVQTIAAAQPAFQAVKAALAVLGLGG